MRTEHPRQQVGATTIGDQAPTDEDLDEARLLDGDHEITGEREVGTETGSDPVDRGHHGEIAIEDGPDHVLGVRADTPRDVTHDAFGHPCRSVDRRLTGPEVGTAAECGAGSCQHDSSNLGGCGRLLKKIDQPLAVLVGEGVA